MIIIYKITNKVNGMVYIGKAKDIQKRWKQHCYDARKRSDLGKFKLQYGILEFGVENFTVEQIDVAATNEDANEKEMHWIRFFDAIEKGYNTSFGGRNGGNYKKVMNVETGEVFNSSVEAAKAMGVNCSAIRYAAKHPKSRCCGYHWRDVK